MRKDLSEAVRSTGSHSTLERRLPGGVRRRSLSSDHLHLHHRANPTSPPRSITRRRRPPIHASSFLDILLVDAYGECGSVSVDFGFVSVAHAVTRMRGEGCHISLHLLLAYQGAGSCGACQPWPCRSRPACTGTKHMERVRNEFKSASAKVLKRRALPLHAPSESSLTLLQRTLNLVVPLGFFLILITAVTRCVSVRGRKMAR